MVQKQLLTGDLVLDLGQVCNLANGKWLVQITAIAGAGATITPSISVDGVTYFNGPVMSPVGGGAGVATAAAVGAWYIDGAGGFVRLTLSGTTPTATVLVQPSCEGGR